MATYVSLTRVRINAQGYDREGRYWGVGEPIYRLDCGCGTKWTYPKSFRALNRAATVIEARKHLSIDHPGMDVRS